MRSRSALHAALRAFRTAWPVLLATLAASLVVVPPAAPAGAATSAVTFELAGQSQWVVAPSGPSSSASRPTRPAASSLFDLALVAHGAPGGATVDVLLFPRLHTRYDFENVVRSGPHGSPLATTPPVGLAALPPDPRDSGDVALDLSVVQSASTGNGSRIGLACAPPTGSGTCTGVYPVVVELQRADGHVLRRFTTFLTYVAGASSHPLELAWVVPVAAPVSISGHPSGPTTAVEPLPADDVSTLETLVTQLRASATVPVTIDPSPQTLQALVRAGVGGRAADAALASMSNDPSIDEVLAGPYVPVDLGALAGAGEPTELTAQMAAGATVLRHLHVASTPSASPWVQTGPVGNDIAAGLAEVGATQLVVPKVDLASTTSATTSGTWSSTFSLVLSHAGGTMTIRAAETDTWLDGQFTHARGDPALAATQFLADLSMIYFERPDTPAIRGMVAVPPAGWVADPTFDHVLLGGLSKNPVVEPVTLSGFFSSVTAAGTRKLLATRPGPFLKRSLAIAVSRARIQLSEFDDSVARHPPVESALDDLLLASESADLRPGRQAAGVSTFEQLLAGQLGLVRFATERTFTLTSRTGLIPITVESRAPYTVIGRLSVSGAKFTFPHHGSRFLRLGHVTNPTRIDVTARTSGDLPLHVVFTSPNGRLVIARDLVTVRSTATSVVGIVLTVVALAILLSWWARSWWTGRRKRRDRRIGRLESGAAAS